MSNVLMCDSCGTVRPRSAARPEGWLSVRTLADLGHVVPDTHPLHHERHLCSTECLRDFAVLAAAGGAVPVDPIARQATTGTGTVMPIEAHRGPVVPAGHLAERGEGGVAPAQLVDGDPAPPEDRAAGSSSVAPSPVQGAAGADGPRVVRLSDLIAQKIARGDGGGVDLRQIADKPAVRRRIR